MFSKLLGVNICPHALFNPEAQTWSVRCLKREDAKVRSTFRGMGILGFRLSALDSRILCVPDC